MSHLKFNQIFRCRGGIWVALRAHRLLSHGIECQLGEQAIEAEKELVCQ